MIAPTVNTGKAKAASKRGGLRRIVLGGVIVAVVAIIAVIMQTAKHGDAEKGEGTKRKNIAGKVSPAKIKQKEAADVPRKSLKQEPTVEEPKTNQWGNPVHWGHKKLRPANVHRINRAQLPLYEQIFNNNVDKTIAGLLVIEPGTDLIGDEVYDENFVKRFLKSIERPIIVSKNDSEEAKSLKRAVIETKIELKARHDAGEDIAKLLTDVRRELRELGAYREEIKKLIEAQSHDHELAAEDMKDFVDAANIMLKERGAKPIAMPEFYYKQLEIRNKRIKSLKGK